MFRALLPISIGFLLGACGGSRPLTAPQTSGEAAHAGRMDNSSPSEQMSEAAPMAPLGSSPAPSREASALERDVSSEAAPRRQADAEPRPGLGTQWGENRDSRVSSAPFDRSDDEHPTATSTLFYNDAEGIRAMTRDSAMGLPSRAGVELGGGALSVRLLDSSGAPLPTYALGARSYVVGDDGNRYVIQIQNHTGQRFETVVSVDGLDVIDGQPASFGKRGYLVGPWASLEIDGFRRSMDQVAAFRFGSVSRSYAASKGDSRNVGVIGVALFNERGSAFPWFAREVEQRHGADAFPGRFATPPR
jgi:hypothetical protein